MPLPLAIPVGLLVGISLAWMARAELARSEVPLALARPFLVSLGLGVLVFAPALGYFAALHGDWAYLYLVRSSRVPSAVDLLFVAIGAGMVPVGFAAAAPSAIAKHGTRLMQASAVLVVVLLAAGALTASRLGVSASFAQYHGGFGAIPIGRSPLGRGVLLSWLALVTAYGWTIHTLRPRRSR